MVDAPVSGSVLTLQQGKLSVMVGGERVHVRSREAVARGPRSESHLRGAQRPRVVDEDRDQFEPGGTHDRHSRRASCWPRRAGFPARSPSTC